MTFENVNTITNAVK